LKLNIRYLPINLGRILIFVISLILAYSHQEVFNFIFMLIIISLVYLVVETFFDISSGMKVMPYLATTFDVIATMIYCYLTGLCAVFYGAFVYITAICALNPRNKQAEYSVFLSLVIQILVVVLVQFNKIKYINLFFKDSQFNLSAAITTIIVTILVNYLVYMIVRKLVRNNYELLCNILPESILPLLEEKKVVSQTYESGTIVFTDFVGFTETTKYLEPYTIVKSLEYYFNIFDSIMMKHKIEKLKTIGDGYMFAAGLPISDINHRDNAIAAAADILEFCLNNESKDYINFNIRIGVSTGPVMAAIIGKKKFQYDVWGATVNLASRLESNAEVNSICTTIDNQSYLESRGFEVKRENKNIKGFGKMEVVIAKKC